MRPQNGGKCVGSLQDRTLCLSVFLCLLCFGAVAFVFVLLFCFVFNALCYNFDSPANELEKKKPKGYTCTRYHAGTYTVE